MVTEILTITTDQLANFRMHLNYSYLYYDGLLTMLEKEKSAIIKENHSAR